MSVTALEPKTDRLVARVSRRQKQLLEQAAAIEERTLAGFVIAHAIEQAESVVRKERVIRLNYEQSMRFIEAMSKKPRRPSAAIKAASKAYKEQVIEL
jgi:uncharacterized protein (DUF1778 family)